jgi:vacuolar-type H+-ATPase subunit I/STV1
MVNKDMDHPPPKKAGKLPRVGRQETKQLDAVRSDLARITWELGGELARLQQLNEQLAGEAARWQAWGEEAAENLNREAERLREQLAQKDELIRQLSRENQELDERLNQAVAEVTRQRPDVATSRDRRQHELAEQFVQLVEQEVRNLIQAVVSELPPADAETRRGVRASRTAAMCAVLFGEQPPDQSSLLAALDPPDAAKGEQLAAQLDSLLQQVVALRRETAQLAEDHVWRFDHHPGATLDPDWQEEWPGCPANGSVEFVVVPAYAPRDKVLRRQRVFTKAGDLSAR